MQSGIRIFALNYFFKKSKEEIGSWWNWELTPHASSTSTYFRLTTSTKSCINQTIKSQEIQGVSLALYFPRQRVFVEMLSVVFLLVSSAFWSFEQENIKVLDFLFRIHLIFFFSSNLNLNLRWAGAIRIQHLKQWKSQLTFCSNNLFKPEDNKRQCTIN